MSRVSRVAKTVVNFGEIMLRLTPPRQERFFQSPELRTYFGGSEANVAASLAHFGVRSRYVTRVPDNALGEGALRALRAEGVDVESVVRGGPRLGVYFVEGGADLRPLRTVYDRAGSSFSQLDPAELDWATVLRGADWLHVSGITPALGEGPCRATRQALEAARAAGVTTSFDLNFRPAVWAGRDPKPVIRPLVALCDVLIGNPGAMSTMLGVHTPGKAPEPPEALHETARALRREFGCRTVAITQRQSLSASEHGWRASLFDTSADAELHTSQRYQVRLVDRVGGGDSFVAGLLYALLAGRDRRAALDFATAASALKLTIPGDFNRVTVDEVDRLLNPHV